MDGDCVHVLRDSALISSLSQSSVCVCVFCLFGLTLISITRPALLALLVMFYKGLSV